MTREEALESARRVAAYLKERHGATRVLLFGSTAHGPFYNHHSDIDLYFEGVPYDSECFATGNTGVEFRALRLDLIGDGHASAELRSEIARTGMVL